MKVKEKKVYYCDFCKKHGLSRPAMEKHERVCTLNPGRHCRWKTSGGGEHGMEHTLSTIVAWLKQLAWPLTEADIDRLREQVSGCPACMLAALRQSGGDYHYTRVGSRLWDYSEEVERFRAGEREEWQQQEYRDLQGMIH